MITTNLANFVTDFFINYLSNVRNSSPHTAIAYRDTIKLLLQHAAKFHQRSLERLQIEDLSASAILEFLSQLESERGNSIRTRNARLAAIHSFFRYVLSREPVLASLCHCVLAIPFKKAPKPTLGYLSGEETKHLLDQIDRSTLHGERDYLIFALLYDTGARVQELLELKPIHFHLKSPAFVRIMGKGRKERLCPLLPQTARLVAQYITTQKQTPYDESPIFKNRISQQLSRHGVRYLLKKYLNMASVAMPSLARQSISPHTLRHAKAMHLLQSGVPLITIKDILGHADIKSTEVYMQADMQMKRKALQQVGTPSRWRPDRTLKMSPDLITWLESL